MDGRPGPPKGQKNPPSARPRSHTPGITAPWGGKESGRSIPAGAWRFRSILVLTFLAFLVFIEVVFILVIIVAVVRVSDSAMRLVDLIIP